MRALQPGPAAPMAQSVPAGNSPAPSVRPAYPSTSYADYWMPKHIATAQNLAASSRIRELFEFLNSAMQQQPELQAPLLCLRSRVFRLIGRRAEGWQDLNQAYLLACSQTGPRPELQATSEQSSVSTVPYTGSDELRISADRVNGQLENELARIYGRSLPHPELGRLPGAGFKRQAT